MEIPLFPLPNVVLFPNAVLPLHIFEDRYKLMINDCIDRNEVFGLVLCSGGAQEESEETIHRVGVTARILEVERLQEGRMNILSRGEERFRIYRFTQQEPYWKASVGLVEDDAAQPSVESLYTQVVDLYLKVCELGALLNPGEQPDSTTPESPTELSYLISYVLDDIDFEDKQRLLEMTSTAERLRVLTGHLMHTIRKQEDQLAYKKLLTRVRGNGDLGEPGRRR